MAERAKGKKTAVARFALLRVSAFWRASQAGIIIAGALLLIAVRVPGVSEVLAHVGIDQTTFSLDVVLPLLLVALFLRLQELSRDIERSVPNREVLNGAMEVYPVLEQRIRATKRPANKTLNVIGMNLYTAWPSLNLQITTGLLDGWHISFAGFIDSEGHQDDWCNPEWSREAYKQLRSVVRTSQREEVISRSIRLSAFFYRHQPAVHGFQLGNGDLFLSILRWREGTFMSVRSYTYDYLPREDQSSAANAMRELFDSWWEASSRLPFDPDSFTASVGSGKEGVPF